MRGSDIRVTITVIIGDLPCIVKKGAALEELTLFDSVENISDAAFADCAKLRTLRVNAAEDPYGYQYRRESLYADKVDLLINARGTRKLVFYGGCSMWYNLIGSEAAHAFPDYTVINMGLNGTVNSLLRTQPLPRLSEADEVTLDPAGLEGRLPALARIYGAYGEKGVRVYVSCACIDREALPPEQRDNGPEMERRLRELIGAMGGPGGGGRSDAVSGAGRP